MSPRRWARSYDSYGHFYRDHYIEHLLEQRLVHGTDAILVEARQPAGDYPDAALPALNLIQHRSSPVRGHFDLGAGRFSRVGARGMFALVPPQREAAFTLDGPHTIRCLSMPWPKLRCLAGEEGALPADGDFGRLHADFFEGPWLGRCMEALWSIAGDTSPAARLQADGLQMTIVGELLKLRGRVTHVTRGGLAPWALRRCTEYLQAHLADAVSMQELASLVGLSPFHFARAFKASTGVPPHAFLRRLRCLRAQELLQQSRARSCILDVALQVGYASSNAFARAFRRETGLAPREWCREHHQG